MTLIYLFFTGLALLIFGVFIKIFNCEIVEEMRLHIILKVISNIFILIGLMLISLTTCNIHNIV